MKLTASSINVYPENTGETVKKKNLSKEAIKKIKYKQIIWNRCKQTVIDILEVKKVIPFIKKLLTKLHLKL